MKARIKKTCEIVNLTSYAKIILEQCDSWGNPIELKPEEVELIQEPTEDKHWQDVRERAAITAMQGIITLLSSSDRTAYREIVVEGFSGTKRTFPDEIAEFAVSCADALIEELKSNQK